jgi:Calx-beta domain-containing protein
MKLVTRLVMAASVILGALVFAEPAQASNPNNITFTMGDTSSYEYVKDCSTTAPYPCTTSSLTMYVEIWTPLPPKPYRDVTFGYAIDPITATQGVDYIGTTGTTVMAAGSNFAFIAIPVINDGVAEPSETLRVRLTSSSIGGDISDTAIGTILDDGQIPADCTLTRPSLMVTSMACTNRPPTQQWQIQITCYDSGAWGYVRGYGNFVTGNGTSTVTCTEVDYDYGYPYFYVHP